jgi:hypothetical protein
MAKMAAYWQLSGCGLATRSSCWPFIATFLISWWHLTRTVPALQLESLKGLVSWLILHLGCNFKSLGAISPYLEHSGSGITSLWARTIALKYGCIVVAGYPEKVDVSERWPKSPEYYNSALAVDANGETIAKYRKSFLDVRDETWALKGPDTFFNDSIRGLGNVALGIGKISTMIFKHGYYMTICIV